MPYAVVLLWVVFLGHILCGPNFCLADWGAANSIFRSLWRGLLKNNKKYFIQLICKKKKTVLILLLVLNTKEIQNRKIKYTIKMAAVHSTYVLCVHELPGREVRVHGEQIRAQSIPYHIPFWKLCINPSTLPVDW